MSEREIADPVIAAVAAHAAAGTPGVVRLETAVAGLLRQLRQRTLGRVAGINPAPTTGVVVRRDAAGVALRISLAVAGNRRVVTVAERVRLRVAQAMTANLGITLAAIDIAVLTIEPAE